MPLGLTQLSRYRRFRGMAGCVLTFAVAVAISTTMAQQGRDSGILDRRIAETVRESGTLESAEFVEVRSPVDATLEYIIESGSHVKPGDRLASLESSAVEKQISSQKLVVAKLEGDLNQTELAVETAQLQADSQLKLNDLRLQAAQGQIESFLADDGELAVELTEAKGEMDSASDQLKAAEALMEITANRSAAEQLKARAEATKASSALRAAQARRKYLDTHYRRKRTRELELEIEELRIRRDVAKREGKAQVVSARVNRELASGNLDRETALLDRLIEQLESCSVVAGQAGIVEHVRPTSRGASLKTGASVRARQALMRIVNPDRLQVRVTVHETNVNRVRPGQRVRVRFEASRTPVNGKVVSVASTPEPTSFFTGNIKEYAVIVAIEENDQKLRIGMTAVAEIATGPR